MVLLGARSLRKRGCEAPRKVHPKLEEVALDRSISSVSFAEHDEDC